MATTIRSTALDFNNIKDNLKTFLAAQEVFVDYVFQGCGMNILLDVLAYNTHYRAYNANMLASDMYLESAHQRAGGVILAK